MWDNVVGYENYFMVSNVGDIYSKRSNKILKLYKNKDTGYLQFSTRIGGRGAKPIILKVHQLVATTFIPNKDTLLVINHKDGDKLNNNVDNLEWVTISENIKHAYRMRLVSQDKGCADSSATLSDEAVQYVRDNPYNLSCRALALIFNVHHTTISRCQRHIRY